MNNDLEKSMRGLLHEMETHFKEYERLDESAEASWSRYFNGSGWPGDELAGIGLAMEKTYKEVIDDLLPRVSRCLRVCAFCYPECSPVRRRFDEFEKTVEPLSASNQIRVSPAEVLIEMRAALLDALRLITERSATPEGGGKNVRHRVLTVEQGAASVGGTNGAEFLSPKEVAARYNVNPKTVRRKVRNHPDVRHVSTSAKRGHTPGRDHLRIPASLVDRLFRSGSREGT